MKSSANLHPAIAKTMAKAIDSYGIDPHPLFSQVDLQPISSLTINSRVDGEKIDALWALAVEQTQDEALGMTFATHFQLGLLSGLGFSWAASETLLDGFKRLSRFFKVISSVGDIEVRNCGTETHVALVLPVPYGFANDTAVDSSLALFLQLCRHVFDNAFCAKQVHYQRPAPKNSEGFVRFFNCDVSFNQSENKLIFNTNELLEPLPAANPDLARANDQVVTDYLRKHQSGNIVSSVTSLIIEMLPSGAPAQQKVAERLHMSSKTLQRRLAALDTGFSSLVDDVRLNLAKTYLQQEWRSIGEICYLLGYTEPSNFGRWFKKNVGAAPVEYRTLHDKRGDT